MSHFKVYIPGSLENRKIMNCIVFNITVFTILDIGFNKSVPKNAMMTCIILCNNHVQ